MLIYDNKYNTFITAVQEYDKENGKQYIRWIKKECSLYWIKMISCDKEIMYDLLKFWYFCETATTAIDLSIGTPAEVIPSHFV